MKAISESVIIMLNPTQMDILGTELVWKELSSLDYGSGYRPIFLINNVIDDPLSCSQIKPNQLSLNEIINTLQSKTRDLLNYCKTYSIRYYHDIHFSEFLTVLRNPSHPFSSQIRNMELLFK